MDLAKWLQIMETYESGGHAYHATMPTDSLRRLRDLMIETERLRLRDACASGRSSSADACARCSWSAASRASRARASRRRASSCRTRRMPTSSRASQRPARKWRPACRSCAASPRTIARSASGSSASTSSTTSTARWRASGKAHASDGRREDLDGICTGPPRALPHRAPPRRRSPTAALPRRALPQAGRSPTAHRGAH